MNRDKKNANVEIGARLREIRENLRRSQADFAELMGISEEHYRKIENGGAGLTLEKILLLYEKVGIAPTYLLTGKKSEDFDLEKYLVNCNKEQRNHLLRQCLHYLDHYFTDKKE